ncbi:MAG TPA: HK97 family phage prohead protease [Nocardioides sp.]|nr:HK97 family phage prohead protease [Nocardioides sp.]
MERRFTKVPVELRARDSKRSIGGYAAVFNRQSSNLGGFVEVVDPAAFNASRGDGWPDVIARYNHDDNMLLGSTGGSTLRLRIDGTGLDYEVDPPAARSDILELVERGDVRKSSFAFRTIEDDWDTNDQGFPQRRLLKVQLVDVAPVNVPAYPDSTAGLRSLADHVGASLDEVRSLAQQDELRKFFRRTSTGAPVKQTFGAAARMALLARKSDPYV